ncbi:MAG: hypothetical protein RB191_19890 [Terriglobia bacterium]|nr:hypothetical protein [Terriglobia bacterium]
MSDFFNVVAVNIKTGAWRVLDRKDTEADAEAYMKMAIMRRGVEEEFYKVVRGAQPLGAEQ